MCLKRYCAQEPYGIISSMKPLRQCSDGRQRGFTIVELLIVIVVIGILASITIVAFNGVQDRARWTQLQSDLSSINKAVQVYHAEHGEYPPTTAAATVGSWRYSCVAGMGNAFIPDVETVASNLKQAPCSEGTSNNDTWIYGSNGVDYKLLHIRPNISMSMRTMVPEAMRDPGGGGSGRWAANGTYGYWSDGASSS